jgi:hypothetical protein
MLKWQGLCLEELILFGKLVKLIKMFYYDVKKED